MDRDTIILGIAALFVIVVYIVDKWNNNRQLTTLTNAVKDKASDEQLVKLAHNLAVGVVPVDTLNRAIETGKTGSAFIKMLTPDDIDALIDAGLDLVGAIASGKPITIDDVVAAVAKLPPASG